MNKPRTMTITARPDDGNYKVVIGDKNPQSFIIVADTAAKIIAWLDCYSVGAARLEFENDAPKIITSTLLTYDAAALVGNQHGGQHGQDCNQ